MTCPPDVAEVVSAILQLGFLRIRSFGGRGDAPRCAIEADHLHNLPVLLARYSTALLQFYWDVEKTVFLSRTSPGNATAFEPLWQKLERLIQFETVEAVVR